MNSIVSVSNNDVFYGIKVLNPDVLFMTATPIPRTLAITAFGEMDVSILDELPAGQEEN